MPELNNTILKNSTNLKAYYRLESGALTTDSSGNSNTLTNNNTVGGGTGKFGECADFGTSNSSKYFSITSDIGVSATADCSFAFWTKLPSLPSSGNRYSFFGKDITGATGSRYNLSYYNNSGTYQLLGNRSRGASGTDTATYAVTLATDTWYHIVVTYSANTLKVYLNSSFVSSVSSIGTGSVGEATALYLGAWNVGGITQYINGNIDDFSIFASALTADQVKELYEGRYIGEFQPTSSTKGLYHLSSTTDSSDNNNTLTNNNSVGFVAGKYGNCADFGTSNTNKSLSRTDGLGIDLSATATINCWVKVRGEPATNASYTLVDLRSTTGTAGRMIFRYVDVSGTKRLYLDRTNTAITYDVTLGTSIWHMLTAVYTASNHYIYLNGKVVVSGGAGNATAGNALNLGGQAGAFANIYLDEVVIENRAWSASEIRKHYAMAMGRYL